MLFCTQSSRVRILDWRQVALAHYRGFQLLEDARILELCNAVKALPEFQNGSCPEQDVIAIWHEQA